MNAAGSNSAKAESGSDNRPQLQTIDLAERRTDELVIALVGAIGSGVSKTAEILARVLEREYNYSSHYIKVSSLIREMGQKLGEELPPNEAESNVRTHRLQELGNKLRQTFDNRYLADKCIDRIAIDRLTPPVGVDKGYFEKPDGEGGVTRLPVNRRRVHIVDSIKHTAEVDRLREVYGDTFWLFGVFAPEEVREARLKRMNFRPTSLAQLLVDDEEDGLEFGQKVRDTAHQADFFVRNDGANEDSLTAAVTRYLRIIFNIGINTPSLDETAMFNAASQASTSACLSRQVGAAIFSEAGELIGVGANDVPKSGGGLYCSADGEEDHRCYKLTGGICHNDEHKERLYAAVFRVLREGNLLASGANLPNVTTALKKTDIRNLIEYSRAVHAEMEAIMSVARGNKPGLVGATLYSTTFPCHSCARHIVAAGINRVVYIEPYAKSLALTLHSDAVSVTKGVEKHVAFLQYEGVAPKNMIRLFKHGIARKKAGKLIPSEPRTASPIFASPLDGFAFREQAVVDNLLKTEQIRITEIEGGVTTNAGEEGAMPAKLSLATDNGQDADAGR